MPSTRPRPTSHHLFPYFRLLSSCFVKIVLILHLTNVLIDHQVGECNLIFANRKDIRTLDEKFVVSPKRAYNDTIIKDGLEDAAAIDFDYEEQIIFWTDAGLESIRGLNLKLHHSFEIISSGLISPDGLACDWITKKIYWADSETKRIEVSRYDGSLRSVLFWTDLDLPRAIILVPSEGLMFWSDWGETAKIERASMDGSPSSRKVIIGDYILWPNGLAIDYETKRLYWADSKLTYISSSDFDGNNRRSIINNSSSLVTLYALTLFGDHLFWTDWKNPKNRGIYVCDKQTGQIVKIYAHSKLEPMGIAVMDASRQPKSPNPCAHNNGGCSHLCLLSSSSRHYSCACPTGVVLTNDAKTCRPDAEKVLLLARRVDMRRISLDTMDYTAVVVPIKGRQQFFAIDYDPVENKVYWTNDELHVIKRASLDGDQQQTIVKSVIDRPDGIAVDWIARNLYWTDSGTDRIEVAHLNGTSRKVLLTAHMDQPRAIVVHPEAGLMFWSDWGKHPKIERAFLDGSNRTVIIDTNIEWPNGLAIDYQLSHIYWCDAKTDLIEMANFDGSNRQMIANLSDHSPHLFGLALIGDYIYLTDWQRRSVGRIHKLSPRKGEDFESIIEQLPDLMGIKAVVLNKASGSNRCAHNNGNCSHLCFYLPHNDRVCGCPNGFELSEDRQTCRKLSAYLLTLDSNEIRRLSFVNNTRSEILISGLQNAVSMSLDYEANQIYYVDSQQKAILRVYLNQFSNGVTTETIIEHGLGKPECVAIDWISKNIYWTDSELGRIEVARQDGSFRRVLLDDANRRPHSLVLSPQHGFLFWSDWSISNPIERIYLDGSKRKSIVENISRASSLTIDTDKERLFYIDLDTGHIVSITWDGKEKTIILMETNLLPVSLAFYNNSIYFFDGKSSKFQVLYNVDGNDVHEFRTEEQVAGVMELAVYDYFSQQGWNPCAVGNGGCDQLCFPRPMNRMIVQETHCSCATHYTLHEDRTCLPPESFLLFSQKASFSWFLFEHQAKHHFQDVILPIYNVKNSRAIAYDSLEFSIYWIDSKFNIKRVPINGTSVEMVVANNANNMQPLDLVIDPYSRLLFWTCGETRSINVTRLNGSPTMLGSIYHSKYDRPHLLAYHFKLNMLFWTNDLVKPQIERISLMTFAKTTILSHVFTKIVALAVDQDLDLLVFYDAYTKRMEYSNLNGQYRNQLYKEEVSPIALSIHSKYLFWVEKDGKTIEKLSMDLNTGNQKQTILSRSNLIGDIISVERMDRNASSLFCAESNGGCSHMCLLNHSDFTTRCACANDLIVALDGKNCHEASECGTTEFRCSTGQCIDLIWRCNGTPDCVDGSDEHDCPSNCLANQFMCTTARSDMSCLDNRLICDGVKHCLDAFDETCCGKNEFRCSVNRNCLSVSQLCDHKQDCLNGEDEDPKQCERVVARVIPSKWYESLIFVSIMGVLFIVIIIFVIYRSSCVAHNPKIVPHIDLNVMDGQASGSTAYMPTNGHLNTGLRLDNCNTMTTTVSEMIANEARHAIDSSAPLLTNGSTQYVRHTTTNANGAAMLVDRVMTGATSSATSSSANNNYPHQTTNPPPSPVASSHSSSLFVTRPTTLRKASGKTASKPCNRRHKKSRWAANLNRGPPPTPCHTDTYEDIEPSNIKYLAYNNTEMDELAFQAREAGNLYQTSYFSNAPSYHPPSPSTERNFTNPFPPPPSPVQEYE